MTTKYYVGKDSGGVYAVYRARYDGAILMSQQQWLIPSGEAWRKTEEISKWYFIGNDDIWESSASEVASYLPAGALVK